MGHVRSRETVESALTMSDRGVSDRENAELHGVAVKTIRRWRRLYQRQGRPRGGRYESPCPRCDGADLDEEAYAHLLGWYLGDGHIAIGRRDVFVLSISNDPKYPRLNEEIAATMRRVKPTASPCLRAGAAIRVETRWTHWPCLFPQHGAGRKHERPIVLEPWQTAIVADHPWPLLRGLFHSDGCRVTNWSERTVAGERRRYEYGRYMFSNKSEDILTIACEALDRAGVPWRRPRANLIAVSRREAVEQLDRFVGPKS